MLFQKEVSGKDYAWGQSGRISYADSGQMKGECKSIEAGAAVGFEEQHKGQYSQKAARGTMIEQAAGELGTDRGAIFTGCCDDQMR